MKIRNTIVKLCTSEVPEYCRLLVTDVARVFPGTLQRVTLQNIGRTAIDKSMSPDAFATLLAEQWHALDGQDPLRSANTIFYLDYDMARVSASIDLTDIVACECTFSEHRGTPVGYEDLVFKRALDAIRCGDIDWLIHRKLGQAQSFRHAFLFEYLDDAPDEDPFLKRSARPRDTIQAGLATLVKCLGSFSTEVFDDTEREVAGRFPDGPDLPVSADAVENSRPDTFAERIAVCRRCHLYLLDTYGDVYRNALDSVGLMVRDV